MNKTGNYEQTLRNVKKVFRFKGYKYAAKMVDGGGYTAMYDNDGRTHIIICRVDRIIDSMIVEIYPEIHCAEEYVAQTLEFINNVNSTHKVANIRIDRNSGSVYAHIENSFKSAPLTRDDIFNSIALAHGMLDDYEQSLDKLAHGRLLKESETIVGIEGARIKMIEEIIDKMHSSLFGSDDDSDEPDSPTSASGGDKDKSGSGVRSFRDRFLSEPVKNDEDEGDEADMDDDFRDFFDNITVGDDDDDDDETE